MQNQLIIPTAEPFFFPGDETGCLLVHGFTGTPKEMHWMGEYLSNRAGHTVLAVRLAGHATSIEDMKRTHWQDWLASVEDGLHLLNGICERVFVIGLSMGGALALLAAAHYPLAGVIAMATPYQLPKDWRLNFVGIIRIFQPEIAKGAPDWRNPDAARDHVSYRTNPTIAVGELNKLLAQLRAALPNIRIPALLMHSRLDAAVPPANMEHIYAALGTTDKRMIWLENSGHVITREPEHQTVFKAAADFIHRLTHSKPQEKHRLHAARD